MSTLNVVDWGKIPAPEDDGAARHLVGLKLPSVSLAATDGRFVDLLALLGRTIVYAYPMTGRPDTPLPKGWDALPGARGCTPQSCSFRDHAAMLRGLGADHIFGLSAQDTDYQREAVERLHLPFPLLSDSDFAFAKALNLPIFDVEGRRLLKRLTMIVDDGSITHIFYPVFPPDRNAADVSDWLIRNPRVDAKTN